MGLLDRLKGKKKEKNTPPTPNVQDDAVKIADESEANVTYLNDLIHSGKSEIILDRDISVNQKDEPFRYGINVDVDDLIIDGNGHTIDARSSLILFNVTAKNVVMKNIKFKNTLGLVQNQGTLKIINVEVSGNFSRPVIYNSGFGITYNDVCIEVIDSTFFKNEDYRGKHDYIIRNEGAVAIIDDCKFKNNSCHMIYNSKGKMEIKNSFICENEVSSSTNYLPDIVENDNAEGKIKIEKTTFSNNFSGKSKFENPAAALITGPNIDITSCIFKDNRNLCMITRVDETIVEKCVFTNNVTELGDSLIDCDSSSLKIIDCEFCDSLTSNNLISNKKYMEVIKCTFSKNNAKNIIYNETDSNLTISFSKFIENECLDSAIENSGKYCSIDNTSFEKSIANNVLNNTNLILRDIGSDDSTKSIVNLGEILIQDASKDLENIVDNQGKINYEQPLAESDNEFNFSCLDKLIHDNENGEILLENDFTLSDSEKYFYEGGIELDRDGLVIDGNGKTIDANGNSRIFIITAKDITLKNIVFKNGKSYLSPDDNFNSNGGIVKCNIDSKLNVVGCHFTGSSSEKHGGSLFSRGEVELSGCELYENDAEYNGGAIYNRGKLTVDDCKLYENTSNGSTGAIFNNNGELKVIDSILCQNQSLRAGGALCNFNGNAFISNTTFENNSIAHPRNIHNNYGGAVFNQGSLEMEGTLFKDNQSPESGGALFNRFGNLKVSYCRFMKNETYGGGAISVDDGKLDCTYCSFEDNEAKVGGAINGGKYIKITDSDFSNNLAAHGGAISSDYGELHLCRCSFNGNISRQGDFDRGKGDIVYGKAALVIKKCNLDNDPLKHFGESTLENAELIEFNDSTSIVKKDNDDELNLAESIENESSQKIIKRTVKKINSQSILKDIALNSSHSIARYTAGKKVNDESVLEKIVLNDPDPVVRLTVLSQIHDESLLAKIAASDEFDNIRINAIKKMCTISNLVNICHLTFESKEIIFNAAKNRLKEIDGIIY